MAKVEPKSSFVQGVRKTALQYNAVLGRTQIHSSDPAIARGEVDPSGLTSFVNRIHTSRLTTSQKLATPKTRKSGLSKGALAEVLGANLLFDSDRIDSLHFLHNELAALVINEAFENTRVYDISGSSLELFRSGISRNPAQRFTSPVQSTGIKSDNYVGLTLVFGRLNYDNRFTGLHPVPPEDYSSINGTYAMPTRKRGAGLDVSDFRVKSWFGTGFILGQNRTALCTPLLHEGTFWTPDSGGRIVENYDFEPATVSQLHSGTIYKLGPTSMLSVPETNRELSQVALRFTMAYSQAA